MTRAAVLPATKTTARPASFLTTTGCVLASAFLIALAQTWVPVAWLCLVGLIPLLVALQAAGFVRIWFSLWLFYCAYFIASVWWLIQTGGGVGRALLIVPVYFVLPFLLSALGLALAPSGPLRLLAFPFLWTAFEFLLRFVFLRLNWTIVGLPLADYPLLSQVASICGPEGVSFLAASVNVLLLLLVTLQKRQRIMAAGGALGLAVLVLLIAFTRSDAPDSSGHTLKLGLVQPAIPEDVIWTPQAREPFLTRITNLINRTTADAPDVVVLPEGAINGLVRYDNRLTDFVRSTVIRTSRPMLFGSYDRQGDAFYNVAIYIDSHNTVTTYRKIRLAPLMEYEPQFFPYRRPGSWLRFTAGTDRTVFSMFTGQRFSTMICLEDSMPELARDFARAGSQLLVSLDSTQRFEGTSEPIEQLRRARLTAIAVGLPMVRCANSGVSCLINPLGRIEKRLREGRPEAAVVDAQLLSLNTVYRITGDWPWLAAMLIAGFGFGLSPRLARRGQSR